LYNRRFFLERWETECDRAKRYGRPLACLVFDVNGFKRINDILGHHVGDQAIRSVAQALKNHLRRSDLLARFGGDEFVVALPETPVRQAALVADKLRGLAIGGPWAQHPQLGPMSLSVGVSTVKNDETPRQALQRADADLYATRQTPLHVLDETAGVA